MKKIVVFTGAGISAESGLSTFRDSDGLWEKYSIEEVCTPEALSRNRALVVEFYNKRRRDAAAAQPNAAHRAVAALEQWYEVEVVTQNVDDLHERAGSSRVTHLHGELNKLRSMRNPDLIVPIEGDQTLDAVGEDGALLRPHIVFFGESVPMFDTACKIASEADLMIVVGTSLAVYPAAMLVRYARPEVPIYLIDP
ncbi:MAG: NAD-dependent deacylase, partial [Alistipes sp.]|nr:NAD-dependent deacylase [Alistipes sp.]